MRREESEKKYKKIRYADEVTETRWMNKKLKQFNQFHINFLIFSPKNINFLTHCHDVCEEREKLDLSQTQK